MRISELMQEAERLLQLEQEGRVALRGYDGPGVEQAIVCGIAANNVVGVFPAGTKVFFAGYDDNDEERPDGFWALMLPDSRIIMVRASDSGFSFDGEYSPSEVFGDAGVPEYCSTESFQLRWRDVPSLKMSEGTIKIRNLMGSSELPIVEEYYEEEVLFTVLQGRYVPLYYWNEGDDSHHAFALVGEEAVEFFIRASQNSWPYAVSTYKVETPAAEWLLGLAQLLAPTE